MEVFELTSAVPHVRHYSSNEVDCLLQGDLLEAVLLSAIPPPTHPT